MQKFALEGIVTDFISSSKCTYRHLPLLSIKKDTIYSDFQNYHPSIKELKKFLSKCFHY